MCRLLKCAILACAFVVLAMAQPSSARRVVLGAPQTLHNMTTNNIVPRKLIEMSREAAIMRDYGGILKPSSKPMQLFAPAAGTVSVQGNDTSPAMQQFEARLVF